MNTSCRASNFDCSARHHGDDEVSPGAAQRFAQGQGQGRDDVAARMILGSRPEHALEPAGEGVWRLPERCQGSCLVYLRDGVDIVLRPVPVAQPGSPDAYAGVVVSALAIADYKERQCAVVEALTRLGRGETAIDDLKWLRDVAANLNGLPASAFDALKLLPSSAETLVHLLLSARDAGERSAIWSLQNELPFLWLALPLRAWRSAMDCDRTALAKAPESALGTEKANGGNILPRPRRRRLTCRGRLPTVVRSTVRCP